MGAALAAAAVHAGHDVCVVSGPVSVAYPKEVNVVEVTTTSEMLEETLRLFPEFDGLIGAAAPCDYMPRKVSEQKLAKQGQPLQLELVETPDIVSTVAHQKTARQWVIGFALETEDQRFRAIVKMEKKCCDMMVSNGATAINSLENDVEILAANGDTLARVQGTKELVAAAIIKAAESFLMRSEG